MTKRQSALFSLIAFAAGLLGGLGSSSLQGWADAAGLPSQPIRTGLIELVDQRGAVRIRLSTDPRTGTSGMSFYDGSHPNPLILASTGANGSSNISLLDAGSKRRVSVDVPLQGGAWISLLDGSSSRATVLKSDDKTVLTFVDANNVDRANLGLTADGDPAFTIYDANGSVVWSAPASH